jgi:hypothetical protein
VTTKSNILELNGRPYDTLTGLMMADHQAHRAIKAIDGFIKSPRHASPAGLNASKPSPASYKTHANPHHSDHTQPRDFDIHPHASQPTHHHQPQRATTLMRHVVHQPAASLKRHTKITMPTDILSKMPYVDLVPKHSISIIDQDRLKRAERIAKSKLVSRFGNLISKAQPAIINKPKPIQPVKATPQLEPTFIRQPSDDVFERALARATSHTQPAVKPHKRVAHKKRLRRFTSFTVASLAVLVIIGFVAYQNVAQIQLRIASSKAGINAVLPKWQPSGFAIGTVHYSPGSVAVNFHGSSSNKNFSLVQTASKWNNTSLFDNFVFPDSNSYETVQAAGNTIYTYNNNNATWVSNGIWYKLISNGALSNSQLVNIAVSM